MTKKSPVLSKQCICKDVDTLHLHRRTVSTITAGLLLCSFLFFLAGYFVGKHHSFDQVVRPLLQQSFADSVQFAVSTRFYTAPTTPELISPELADNELEPEVKQQETESVQLSTPVMQPSEGPLYQVEVAGFGTLGGAQECLQILKRHGVQAQIATITSSSKRGRRVQWYQVVSPDFSSQEDVLHFSSVVKQAIRVHGMRLVSKKNGKKQYEAFA